MLEFQRDHSKADIPSSLCDGECMQVLALINRKGGCGKSTIAVNVAAAMGLKGKRVKLIDMDPQQSAARWIGDDAIMLEDAKALPRTLKKVSADVVVIDTPPSDPSAAIAASKVADLVLIPAKPSPLDLEAAGPILKTVANGKMRGLVVLSMAKSRARATTSAGSWLNALGVGVADTVIVDRTAHIGAAVQRRSVIEYAPDSKAAEEIRSLTDEVLEILALLKKLKST